MREIEHLRGKSVFVAGASSGLGRELSKLLAAQGANLTIFARRQRLLDETRAELLSARRDANQAIDAVSLDLADPHAVINAFQARQMVPDILYCVAGGCANECGFLTDIDANSLETCMRNNYFAAAYPAQTMLKLWADEDKVQVPKAKKLRLRQIVFINSAAAFLGLPGYGAYTAAKCAVRGLADTLRMEAIRLSNTTSRYTIHCAFPSNFISPAFISEQRRKPDLTKELEGTTGTLEEWTRKYPSSEKVAEGIVLGVEKGDFALCDDSFESSMLFANMVGPSPKRGFGIVDSVMAVVIGTFIWPGVRRMWDAQTKRHGKLHQKQDE